MPLMRVARVVGVDLLLPAVHGAPARGLRDWNIGLAVATPRDLPHYLSEYFPCSSAPHGPGPEPDSAGTCSRYTRAICFRVSCWPSHYLYL